MEDLYNFLTIINKHTLDARISEVGKTLQSVYCHVMKWHMVTACKNMHCVLR